MTIPSVPPYSSTTIARWWFSRRISLSAASTPSVPGSRFTSRARSPTVAARPAGWLGRNRSRTCTKPTTSSSSRPATGKRDQLESATCLAARLAVIDAVEERDLGARRHDLADLALAGAEDLVDQPALVAAQRLVRGHQVAQLLLADRLTAPLRVAAEEPDQHVRRLRQQPDDRAGERGDRVERRGDEQREALGPLQRQALGGQLADDERDVADRDGDEDQRERCRRGPRTDPRSSSQPANGCDSVLAPKAAEKKPAKVTPTWTAARKRLGSLSRRWTACPRRPLSAIAADLGLAEGDQRDLRAGEDAADQDEDDDHDDAEPDVAHRRRAPRGIGWGSTPPWCLLDGGPPEPIAGAGTPRGRFERRKVTFFSETHGDLARTVSLDPVTNRDLILS